MTEFEAWKAGEADAYLRKVRRSSLDIQRISDEIDLQRSILPRGIDYSREVIASSPRKDALEASVLRVLDLIESYCTELAAYVDMQREAHEAIARLDEPKYRSVLTLYYLEGHPWRVIGSRKEDGKTISGLLPYSVDWCKELRSQALPLFWDVMPRNEKTNVPKSL